MASTYSTNLAIELIGTGDQAGSWGNTTNTNLGTLIEQAISGYVTQAVSTGTDTTITIPNGATGVARNMYIELTGTGGASTNLIVPANKKLYFIFNNASGAVTVKVSGQTGVSVPAGKKVVLASNGTDAVNALNYIAEFGSNSATITQLTATSATITNLTLTSLVISNLSIASANITTLTSSSATITNLLGTTLTISGNTFLATSSGNVGIGTSSPSVKLHVKGSGELARLETTGATGNNYLNFADASADKAYVGFTSASTETFVVQNIENGAMLFATNNTERARITSGGGFLVGANPTEIGTNSVTTASSGSTANGFACIVSGYAAAFFGINNTASTVRGVPASSFGVGTADGIPLTFATNNTEKMRLDTSGNLGLGVSPSAWGSIFNAMQLGDGGFIAGRSDVFTQLQLGCNGYYDGSNFKFLGTGRAARYYQDGGEHYWETSASGTAGGTISFTQAMTLTSGGNLLVGSTNLSSPSTTYVNARIGTVGNVYTGASGSNFGFVFTANSYQHSGGNNKRLENGYASRIDCRADTGQIDTLTAGTANAGTDINFTSGPYIANLGTSWTNSSDERLKEITGEIQNGVAKVCKLRAAEFTWKNSENKKPQVGLIAQDVLEVLPEVVVVPNKEFDGTAATAMGVNYDQVVPLLVAAIKEQAGMINDLKAEVAALKGA